MVWSTVASELSVGPPTGLTLMPTTSPFSKNERHASVQLGAPVSEVMPFSIILRTGSAWYAPLDDGAGMFDADHQPGKRSGHAGFGGGGLAVDLAEGGGPGHGGIFEEIAARDIHEGIVLRSSRARRDHPRSRKPLQPLHRRRPSGYSLPA